MRFCSPTTKSEPFDIKKILSTLNKALLKKFSNNYKPEKIELVPKEFKVNLPLIGRSQSMQEVYRVIARLINTDLTVMIIGASGTGKELVARALHDFGKRKEKPFVVINLGSIPSDQVEKEIFGNNDNDINNDNVGSNQSFGIKKARGAPKMKLRTSSRSTTRDTK